MMEIWQKHRKRRPLKIALLFFLLSGIFFLAGCPVQQRVCGTDAIQYCDVRGNFTGQWYDFYERALSCMEGGCYASAQEDLTEAIARRYEDQRRARAMGMHFLDYFPHRELGLVHYLSGNDESARDQLELSIAQYPSEKAHYYLDLVRKRLMASRQLHPTAPVILLSSPEADEKEAVIWTRDDPVRIAGIAKDEQFVSAVRIGEKEAFLEASGREVQFEEQLRLDGGRHEIPVVAENLPGQKTVRKLIFQVDRSGPVLLIERFVPRYFVKGHLFDDAGGLSLSINGRPAELSPGKRVGFDFELSMEEDHVEIAAWDRLGNETRILLPDSGAEAASGPLFASNDPLFALWAGRSNRDAGPIIRIDGLAHEDLIYRESLPLEAELKGANNIETVEVNGADVPVGLPGKHLFINRFVRLAQGRNEITVQATDARGLTSHLRLPLIRKVPEVMQVKHRYGLSIHPFEFTQGAADRLLFQYRFLDHLVELKRFRLMVNEDLRSSFAAQNLLKNQGEMPENGNGAPHAVLLGILYETREGMEIAARIVEIESRQTLATADVFLPANGENGMDQMSARLARKFFRSFPMVTSDIIHIFGDRMEVKPTQWMPVKGNLRVGWPLLVYREQSPENDLHGSDMPVLQETSVIEIGDGTFSAELADQEKGKIRLMDRVITR